MTISRIKPSTRVTTVESPTIPAALVTCFYGEDMDGAVLPLRLWAGEVERLMYEDELNGDWQTRACDLRLARLPAEIHAGHGKVGQGAGSKDGASMTLILTHNGATSTDS